MGGGRPGADPRAGRGGQAGARGGGRAAGGQRAPGDPAGHRRAAGRGGDADLRGIVLRDLDAGLVDFPARLEDGRGYLLCWVLGEPAVEWWHWPDTGFAGRRPLSDPPG
ncbi:MAG TPA: DUF2203 family protein [Actinomycetota bacterium]|nr:DUF2203 family protein [Actinomycetota bacterium]